MSMLSTVIHSALCVYVCVGGVFVCVWWGGGKADQLRQQMRGSVREG